MRNIFTKYTIGVVLVGALITACVLPEKSDPFERLPDENLETIEGKLFPFSVSVSTRATHRLEKDGKLVGYLTSDIVQLADFEGRDVDLDGVWRNEKMRQIFWVEAIRVTDIEEETEDEEPTSKRFTTKGFTFVHPSNWEATLAPDGAAYFVNKLDPNRRVFFTLKVEDYSPEGEKIVPNILFNGFAGIKDVTNETSGKEKETVTLFSNLGNQKYVFEVNYDFEDFDTKKAFLDLLNSFVEGEDMVLKTIEQEQKELAEQEATKLAESQAEEEATDESEDSEEATEEEPSFLDRILGKDEEATSEPVVETSEAETPAEPEPEVEIPADGFQPGVYNNLNDERAFFYENNGFGFSMTIPFGLWYRHYGPGYANITEMGFADNPINSRDDVKFWMRIINKEKPDDNIEEIVVAGRVTIIKKRDATSVYEFNGPVRLRDQMWSIIETVQ